MNRYVNIRIRATGQVTEMVPDVARAMISSGMAEEVGAQRDLHLSAVALQAGAAKKPETMAVTPTAERAVAPAQHPAQKSTLPRKRVG
jgi:hypothetical protein